MKQNQTRIPQKKQITNKKFQKQIPKFLIINITNIILKFIPTNEFFFDFSLRRDLNLLMLGDTLSMSKQREFNSKDINKRFIS